MKIARLSVVLATVAAVPAMAQQAQGPAADPAPPAAGQQATPPVTPQAAPQSATPKATGGAGSTLPQVEIIQQPKAAQPAPAAKAAPKTAAPPPPPAPKAAVAPKAAPKAVAPVVAKKAPAPFAVTPPPPVEPVADVPANPNPVYGAANSGGAAERAAQSSQTPINPRSLTPTNLQGFSAAATNIDAEALAEQQPRNVNEVFKQVPGVIVVNDDASGHHGGISLRGSPPRRSRKVLVLEDGVPVNLALWLDPSVHYWAPVDRLESVEVLRGTVITHGPHNNFGVINARNLSPFGPAETVVGAAIGFTQTRAGSYTDEDGVVHTGKSEWDLSSRWHVHTRQHAGNVGLVASYTGENVQGAWDTERLRFHDFYGAIGWKGVDQDLTVSVVYAKQKDNYDEANLIGNEDGPNGNAEAAFFDAKHCKTCFAPGAFLNTYEADILRAQITHNMFVDRDTTLTTRLYGGTHRRDRFQTLYNSSNPAAPEASGIGPGYSAEYEENGKILRDAFVGNDSMFGRLRTFRHIGVEGRAELANRPFLGGLSQDIQVGLRYEHQDMKNRNFLGKSGEILKYGDSEGLTIFDRSLKSDAISAFLQTSVKATSDLRITPGVRLEWYKVRRKTRVAAVEEGEADEFEDGVDFNESGQTCSDVLTNYGEDECHVIEGLTTRAFEDSTSSLRALPGIAFSYDGLYRTTIYGGYHRGQTKLVLRNEDFPAADEIGDNFELGFRSSAVRGITVEVAGFHQRLKNFQYGASFSTAGDRSFGTADEVHINGVELGARINSHPWIGGPVNLYTQGQYTYARSIIKRGTTEDGNGNVVDLAGKHLPEVPFHIAALTLGIEGRTGWKWNASATYTYRGAFFTDEVNTAYGGDPEGENGRVPGIWLLSARFNLDIGNTGASVFVSGDNLLDKLYITDREDGIKPGIGRTIWTGFKYKF